MMIASNSQLAEPLRKQKNCDEEEQRRRLKEEDWQIATPAEKRNCPPKGRKEGRQAGRQASKQARTARLPEEESKKIEKY